MAPLRRSWVALLRRSLTNVTRWVREHRQDAEQAANGQQNSSELKAEIRRLKKENQRLQMEREILKKAAAFFAKESV